MSFGKLAMMSRMLSNVEETLFSSATSPISPEDVCPNLSELSPNSRGTDSLGFASKILDTSTRHH